jgi:alkylation response protein AidB-like acyl-CoA dehydrogenase
MASDFSFTDEHQELRATVRQFIEDRSPETAVREHMASETGWDRDIWNQMAEQMGLAGLIIPEIYGGAGFGYVELLVVMEEMGRGLLCSPYLATAVLASNALLECTTEAARKELLTEIAAGRAVVTVAHAEPNGRWDVAGIEMTAREKDGGWLLDGAKTCVLDGCSADVILVAARTPAGLEIFRVDGDGEGVARHAIAELDTTRRLSRIEFSAAAATRLSEGDQSDAFERVLARTVSALAAEQVGGAQRCLDMAVDYAKTRLQFGRPIGSFQAIKHKCADLLVEVEFAKSGAYNACFTIAEGGSDELAAAAIARSYCSQAYYDAAAENIQIHGGMGFTWEHPAHLYFKRAKASQLLFGDPSLHREMLAARVGI